MKNYYFKTKNAVRNFLMILLTFILMLSLKTYAANMGGDDKVDEQTQIYQNDKEYIILSNPNQNTLFIKFFRKDVGDLFYYTEKGIQIYNAVLSYIKRKNWVDNTEENDECKSKFRCNFEAGFVENCFESKTNNTCEEQFLALSAHYNNLCVRFIWILTESGTYQ